MSDINQWKNKFQDLMQVCQSELKKTAEIGKKMISAGQTNSELEESYVELAKIVCAALDSGELNWSNEKALELVEKIKSTKKNLEQLEKDVQDIKN